MKFRALQLLLISSLLSIPASALSFADSGTPPIEGQALSTETPLSDTIPIKTDAKTDKKKSKRTDILSKWVIQQLDTQNAKVAVISRIGSNLAVLFDKTGMTHSGYVFKHPVTHKWITYSLYSDPTQAYKKSKVWQQGYNRLLLWSKRQQNRYTSVHSLCENTRKTLYSPDCQAL